MLVGSGEHTYEWIENWASIPESESARTGWAHPGLAVTSRGQVVSFHPGDPTLLVLNPDGSLVRTIDTELVEGHGITAVSEGAAERLWVSDPAKKSFKGAGYSTKGSPEHGRVVRLTMDGRVELTVEKPDLSVYLTSSFRPTGLQLADGRRGGSGDLWIADGYGASCVHRYRTVRTGVEYVGTIDGQEGTAGRFSCPHAIWIDTRRSEPELYVADRGNRRVQVYDLEGKFKRVFGDGWLISPSGFARWGDFLIIAELHARLTVVDGDDRLVGYLGRDDEACQRDGWPNARDEDGLPVRPRLEPGRFNSPHGIAADGDGNIYVAEWVIGGRTVKLARAPRAS